MNKWLNWTPPAKEKDIPEINEEGSEEAPLYFGMSPNPVTSPDRLKQYWSVLGECIDERKQFIFQCNNEEEADELKKLTYSMVFQINDIWEVYLDDLVVKARPPRSNAVPNGNQTTKD